MKKFLAFAALTFALSNSGFANEHEATGPASGHGNTHADAHAKAPAHKWKPLYNPKNADRSLVTRPAKVEIAEPAFFAVITGGSATLKWKAVDGADAYFVEVATDPNFKWLVKSDKNAQSTELTVSSLEAGQDYYWRVAALRSKNDANYLKGDFAKSMFTAK